MRENRVAQSRVWQPAEHCCLDGRRHFARFGTKRSESQDAVALGSYKHFHKSPRFANRNRPQYTCHGHLRQSIKDASRLRIRLVQADSRQFWISEHTKGDEPVARRAAAPVQVIENNPKIVEGDVRELRAACAI